MEANKAIVCTQCTAERPGATPIRVEKRGLAANLDWAIKRAGQKAREEGDRAALKKMGGVFKSMLLQQGLAKEEAARLTAEWQAHQLGPQGQIAAREARIAGLESQLEELRRREQQGQKRAFFENRLEEEGLHPDAAKLLLQFIDLEPMTLLEDGQVKEYEAVLQPVRQQCPALFKAGAARCPACRQVYQRLAW